MRAASPEIGFIGIIFGFDRISIVVNTRGRPYVHCVGRCDENAIIDRHAFSRIPTPVTRVENSKRPESRRFPITGLKPV